MISKKANANIADKADMKAHLATMHAHFVEKTSTGQTDLRLTYIA